MSQVTLEIVESTTKLEVNSTTTDINVTETSTSITLGNSGPQGVKGDTGSTGSTGPEGSTGPQGATGAAGAKGDKGDTGNTGLQGIQGIQGVKGDQGIQGEVGPTGLQGIEGPQGPQGIQGIQGIQGEEGVGINLLGSKNTIADLPESGNNGDAWIVQANGDLYVWDTVTDTWDNVGQIVGPEGPQGPQGIQGIQGEQGIQGATGATGAQGPQGQTGAQGIQGIQGLTGDTGATGATGATGPSGVIAVTSPITNSGTSTSAELGLLDGGVTNAKLANSSVTIGSNTLSLGGSLNVVPALDWVSGSIYRMQAGAATINTTTHTTYYSVIYIPSTMTINQISILTSSTWSGTGSIRLGIYANASGRPQNLILDAGLVSATAASTAFSITISQALTAGFYWLAANVQTAPTTQSLAAGSSPTLMTGLPSIGLTSSVYSSYNQTSVTGAFANAGSLNPGTTYPLVFLRRA